MLLALALGVVPAALAAAVFLACVLALWWLYTKPAAEGETGRVFRSRWGTALGFAFAFVLATVVGASALGVRVYLGTLTVRPRRAGGFAASVPVDDETADALSVADEPAPLRVVERTL